ncbi:hypothetical protein OH797_36605 [Streptomyces anulatus]|uniref:Uncharacterized protein n=1 Tax=Streptomyces anulatus TaxID=1892 RepID=A0ABZ1ZST7_STRAQ|nr:MULTISPECIES: hypothetical protein [Streptomyces]EHM30889.1 hypothetical protein SPW_0712 [Streptomyces sp. W007]
MSSLALLVALVVVMVVLQAAVGLAYLAHRHPEAATPLLVGIGGTALIASWVIPIVVGR